MLYVTTHATELAPAGTLVHAAPGETRYGDLRELEPRELAATQQDHYATAASTVGRPGHPAPLKR